MKLSIKKLVLKSNSWKIEMILAYRGRQTSRGTFWINLTIALTSLTQWHPSEVAAGVAIGGEG